MPRAKKRRRKKEVRSQRPPAAAPHPLYQQGVSLFQAGRWREAEAPIRRLLAREPRHANAHQLLGLIAIQGGDRDAAIAALSQAMALEPGQADHPANLGLLYMELGRRQEALACFRRVLEINPNAPGAHNNLGNLLHGMNHPDDAEAAYRQALTLQPDAAETHNNLADLLIDRGRPDEAETLLRDALERMPGLASAHNNLGRALMALGRPAKAERSYLHALEIAPGLPEALNNLGNLLTWQGRLDEAEICLRRALDARPQAPELHNSLGNLLRDAGRLDEAEKAFRQALARQSDMVAAHNNLGDLQRTMGRLTEAMESFRTATALPECPPEAHSNLLFMLNADPAVSPKEQFAQALEFGARAAASAQPTKEHPNDPDPDRRLRVGLVSGDLRNHPVGIYLRELLGELDRDAVELYAFPANLREDDLTRRFKEIIPHWIPAAGLDNQQLAQRVADRNIDILIDLSGHTKDNRLPLFAWKPAPVQVTWMGYTATTGLKEMDYILCDRWVMPEGAENQFTERPWRLPEGYLCFSAPERAVATAPPPRLENGFTTFGSFNNPSKITPEVVACWSRILRAAPESRLFLKCKQLGHPEVRRTTAEAFSRQRVDPGRLILEGGAPHEELLTAYNRIDIALDPFPYTGGITTMEALWMGVPVLTLRGDSFLANIGESILRSSGLPEWVAHSQEEYVEIAVARADDPAALTELRRELRDRFLASPAGNTPRFARHLEQALRGMWKAWVAR